MKIKFSINHSCPFASFIIQMSGFILYIYHEWRCVAVLSKAANEIAIEPDFTRLEARLLFYTTYGDHTPSLREEKCHLKNFGMLDMYLSAKAK